VIVDEKGIKDSWKDYMEKLMNEEIEWDHGISAAVKEGPPSITPSFFHARLKTYLFHKSFPP